MTKMKIAPVAINRDGSTKRYRIREISGKNGAGIALHNQFLAVNDLQVKDEVACYISSDGVLMVVAAKDAKAFEARNSIGK